MKAADKGLAVIVRWVTTHFKKFSTKHLMGLGMLVIGGSIANYPAGIGPQSLAALDIPPRWFSILCLLCGGLLLEDRRIWVMGIATFPLFVYGLALLDSVDRFGNSPTAALITFGLILISWRAMLLEEENAALKAPKKDD